MTYPKVLVVSATPLQGPWATSRLMADLFAQWPSEFLAQVTITRPGSDPKSQTVESLYLDIAGTRNPFRVASQIRRLFAFVDKANPDVLYFRSAGWPVAFELMALLLVRYPMVTHIMDDWPESRRVAGLRLNKALDAALRRVLVKSDARLAISQPMATAFAERYGVPFDVVHAGTDHGPQTPDHAHNDRQEKEVFYSGSIAEDQTASSLIELAVAVELLRSRGVSVQLRITPSSEMPKSLRTRLKSAGAAVDEQSSQAGYFERLASADVVVATANFDPRSIAFLRYSMPNKIPDLLASGTPVLVFAPAELAYVQLASQAGWAYVVDTEDTEVLASAIEYLLQNDEARARLVAAAAEACESTFAWPMLRDRFEQTLRAASAPTR